MTIWRFAQLVDSAFPTGGFAHSGGLEAAWQQGEVPDAPALRRFVRASVLQAGYGALPFVNEVHRRPDALEECDALAEAFFTNPVTNRASRVQGRAWLSTASRVWPGDAMASLGSRARPLCVHVAPIVGATLRTLDVPLRTAQQLVLFTTVRGVLSAAVRLGIAGSYEAQRIQAESAADLDDVLNRCTGLGSADVAQTAPILDILHSAHDRLYSRLFSS